MKNTAWDVSPSPFIFAGCQLTVSSVVIIASLVPHIALMAFFRDVQALAVIFASVAGAALAEFCFKPFPVDTDGYKRFVDGGVFVSGLATGFVLPTMIHPALAAAASFFGVCITRNFFNGKGNAWLNPAAFAAVFAFISSPDAFHALAETAYLHMQTPMDFDSEFTRVLNTSLFRPLGINLPGGYVSLFFNPAAPVAALKFGVLTLFASAFLIAFDVIDRILPAVFITVYSAAVYASHFLWRIPSDSFSVFSGDILFHLLSNGVLFIGFYLLSDPSSSPRTKIGRVAAGFFAGAAAFFFCGPHGSPAGAVFSVFAVNVASPLIELIENKILGVSTTETFL